MKAHAVAGLIPAMTENEYVAMKADIQEHGLHEAIWVHDGQIIDGRHRYRACDELGITPTFREWDGRGSLVSFVLSLNLHRRHLTTSQRTMLATHILPALAIEAKERQVEAGRHSGRGQSPDGKVPTNSEEPIPGESAAQAASLLGVGASNVYLANKIKKAAPDIAEKVMKGEINMSEAERQVKVRAGRRDQKKQRDTPTPPRQAPRVVYDQLCFYWAQATAEERERFRVFQAEYHKG